MLERPTHDDQIAKGVKLSIWCPQRALLMAGLLSYVACFNWVYLHYLNAHIAYFGFVYEPPAFGFVVFGWILALAPSLWMPIRLKRPSQLAYWMLYLVVIIPSMLVPLYADVLPLGQDLAVMLTLLAGFAITGLSYGVPLARIQNKMMPPRSFQHLLFGCLVVAASWFFYVHRGALALVSFDAVYDLRLNAEQLMEGSFVSYAGMLLSGAIDPFLMAWGLYCKRPFLVAAGAFGQVLIYAGWGTKGSISSIAFIGAFYLLLRGNRSLFGVRLVIAVTSVLVLFAGLFLMSGSDSGIISSSIFFLVFARTFSVQGLLTAQYYDFFQHNPLTHYATVNGIKWFIHNPYSRPIGIEVGYAVSGDPLYDAIAHFWASDGIAAWGLPGILLISLLCAFVFWILDSAAQRHDPRFGALVTCYAAYNLANIPLFTSLLSGGLGALALWLYLMPPQALFSGSEQRNRAALPCNFDVLNAFPPGHPESV